MTLAIAKLALLPDVFLWPGYFTRAMQKTLLCEVRSRIESAPFYRPRMPRSGAQFSVEETNFGSLGWYSDQEGYRYETTHPLKKTPWPDIPDLLLALWHAVGAHATPPECCLVNLYRNGARMGLHQDRDEKVLDAAVVSVSLGDSAVFRIGGTKRRGPTMSVTLQSGDVVMFGGRARLAYHGVDRVIAGTSTLIEGGGRINLTLRRITPVHK